MKLIYVTPQVFKEKVGLLQMIQYHLPVNSATLLEVLITQVMVG